MAACLNGAPAKLEANCPHLDSKTTELDSIVNDECYCETTFRLMGACMVLDESCRKNVESLQAYALDASKTTCPAYLESVKADVGIRNLDDKDTEAADSKTSGSVAGRVLVASCLVMFMLL